MEVGDIGFIFHWGLYSVPAYDNVTSARRRKMQNGSEWYQKRLDESGNYHPISGWKDTQIYHQENYGDKSYEEFGHEFKAENWNPDSWMKLCVEAGAKYVIITAKHHDGFCLFKTKTTNNNSVDIGPKRDIVEAFQISAKKFNLKFGIYYSWTEFRMLCTKKYIDTIMIPQMDELKKYMPDIWWFDGDWNCKTNISCMSASNICEDLHKINPSVIINDRIPKKDVSTVSPHTTYRVYEDRYMPKIKLENQWEHINTIGLSWGRNKDQKEKDYKNGKELYELYNNVKNKGGRFLLNFGPDSSGELDPFEVKSIREFMELNKEQDIELIED